MILSENRQIANQVVGLAFDVARASADQLVEARRVPPSGAQADDSAQAPAAQTLAARQHKLDAQARSVQSEMDSTRARLAARAQKGAASAAGKIAELQGELDLINAKKSMIGSIATVVNGSDVRDASSLRSQIDAMAVALPGTASGRAPAAGAPAAQHPAGTAAASAAPAAASRFGVWDEAANVFKLSEKVSSIDAIDRRTAALQAALVQIQSKLVAELRALSARGDALMAQADSADSAALGATRDQLDALANQFKQASALFVPLRKQAALLDQYRRNLKNWRDAVEGPVAQCARVSGHSSRRARAHPGRGVRACRAVASRRAQIRAGFAQALSALASAQDRALDSGRHHHRIHVCERA